MYEALTFTNILSKFLSHKSHKGINATMHYYFPSPDINETKNYLNSALYYLVIIAKLIKVYSFIEHQSVGKYPRKWHILIRAQIYYNTYERSG